MWRYNKTENLYYSRDKSNKLYHSDTYLGETYNDGLYHWKYIKKERKNGRWVYYYSDAEYDNAKNNLNIAKNNYYDSEKKLVETNTNYEQIQNSEKSSIEDKEAADVDLLKAYNKYAEAGKKYTQAKKNWENIKVKTATRRTIGKGITAVANAISKLNYKIKTKIKETSKWI